MNESMSRLNPGDLLVLIHDLFENINYHLVFFIVTLSGHISIVTLNTKV